MPKFAAFKAHVLSMLHVDWAEVKQLFLRDGLFWLAEYALIAMAAYSIAHLFRSRTLLSKPICRIVGHEWFVTERDAIRYSYNRDILGERAGSKGYCSRCGKGWSDLPGRSELDARRRAEQPPRPPRPRRTAQATPRTPVAPLPQPVSVPAPGPRRKPERKKKATKATTRFDRELELLEPAVIEEPVVTEEPKTEALAPQGEQTPEKSEDTDSPTGPSSPADSEPS